MPIRVVCPNGHALRVKDKLAGKPGVCPTCQADFIVPDPQTAAPAAAGPPSTPAGPAAPAAPASAAPTPAEAVEWRVTLPDGQQFGPTVPTVFGQWILAERVTADCLVWRTGWAEWRTAADAAAELPAPLPTATIDPAAPAVPELPTGVTLPPETTASEPSPSESPSSTPVPVGGAYTLRKKRQARQRRNLAILLAVACLALIAMLVWLVVAGPPATLPVVPPE